MADALLSPAVGGTMYAASIAAIVYSTKKIKREELGDSKIPLMAVSGAMIFAVQMINFIIPGTGSSGHISGGILLAALLGPYAGMLAMSAVLIIQCLCFADGGLLALGSNIFNIGVIPCLIIFPLIMKPILTASPNAKRIWASSIISTVLALQLGAFAIVLQTTSSGIAELPFGAFVLLMQPIHLAIGVIEGLVTAAILCFVYAARPQILESNLTPSQSSQPSQPFHMRDGETGRPSASKTASMKKVIIVFACAAIALAAGLSLISSGDPDGLEWATMKVADSDEPKARGSIFDIFSSFQERLSFAPGYGAEKGDWSEMSVAGLIGALMVFALAAATALIIRIFKKRQKRPERPGI